MSTETRDNRPSVALDENYSADQRLPSTYVAKGSTSKSPQPGDELLRADAGNVQATTVSMDRSGAETINAERLTMDHSGAKSIETRSIQLTDSGAVMIKSEHAVLQNSSAAVVATGTARLVKTRAIAIIAGNVTGEGEIKTLLHVGPSESNMRTVVSATGAIGFGAALGMVLLVFGRLRKVFFGKR